MQNNDELKEKISKFITDAHKQQGFELVDMMLYNDSKASMNHCDIMSDFKSCGFIVDNDDVEMIKIADICDDKDKSIIKIYYSNDEIYDGYYVYVKNNKDVANYFDIGEVAKLHFKSFELNEETLRKLLLVTNPLNESIKIVYKYLLFVNEYFKNLN